MRTIAAPLPQDEPLTLNDEQQAQLLACDLSDSLAECQVDLKWGFFFDGTNNNLERDRPQQTHSNVGRLHDVFELDAEKPEQMRRYIAGVGTPFYDEVGDNGLGIQQKAGLAAGWGGEARINWALLKLCDNLHYYFERKDFGEALGEPDRQTVKRMSADLNIPILDLRRLEGEEVELLREVGTLSSVQTLTATALNGPRDRQRRQVLAERRQALRRKLDQWLRNRKPKVRRIHLSVFGFSRGAAEARVFCSWLQDALDADFSLCGIPVQVDFLGIFDTVASVGMANSSLVFDGHGGWGRERDLRVPSWVRRCVHMVAALEVRGSFPLDAYRGECPSALQIVYPGVHSDIGGGYGVGEQGKGFVGDAARDSAKFSQFPLVEMYNQAVAAGVPLNVNSTRVPQRVKDGLLIAPPLRNAYRDFIAATTGKAKDELVALVRLYYGLYLRWRRLRLGAAPPEGLAHQPFVQRARRLNPQDEVDLLGANRELAEEEQALLRDERDPALRSPEGLGEQVAHVVTRLGRSLVLPLNVRDQAVSAIWSEKMAEWREVKPYWYDPEPLPAAVIALFDDHAHDSRAWFKPFGADSEAAWRRGQTERLQKLDARDKRYREWKQEYDELVRVSREGGFFERQGARQLLEAKQRDLLNMPREVTGDDLRALEAWRRNPNDLPHEVSGREPWSLFGYLRWRTMYLDRASWAQRAGNAVQVFVDERKQNIRDARDNVLDRARDAAGEVINDAIEAGKRGLIEKAKELIPNGMPRL